ncbi:PAS domain S-box protein [Prosthecobacter vanneervenii]|uniref:histidine kinase n=1 Tax=Prosthecobacter vanneervenii TaxID=48466 RepID=A0A7W7Y991_9BACT|nr:PAS domain S-box protein [Prosthecobacter vanneervenii]MBB5031767.1 PAS domain S-box-containing protein [Prosthecobacter vanneervenii]
MIFLLLTGIGAWWSQQQNAAAFDSFDHTHRVNDTLDAILLNVLTLKKGATEFALSGDEATLRSYQDAKDSLPKAAAKAQQLMQENPRQQQRMALLAPLLSESLDQAAGIIQMRRSGDTAGAHQRISQDLGRKNTEAIRSVILAMKAEESDLLPEIKSRTAQLYLQTKVIVGCGTLLSLCVLLLAHAMMKRDTAKRLQAETERDLFFTVPLDMLCIISEDGYLKRANPALSATLGWSVEELLARPYAELLHPDDRAPTAAEIQRQLLVGEGVLQYETRCLHKDGSYRVFWWRSVPQPGGLIYASGRDVTAQKAAAEVLRSSEEKLSVTLNSIGDAVLATDAERRITRLNPVAEKLTGWTLQEALGHPVDEVLKIIHEETRQPATLPVDEVLASGEIRGLASRTIVISRHGAECPIRDSAAPIRDSTGRIIGVVLVFHDSRQENQMEHILREGEALSRAIIDSMPANVAVVDRQGTIIAVNNGWERFARENGAESLAAVGLGVNYLEVCERAVPELEEEANEIMKGLRGVLDLSLPLFSREYPCHSPTEKRWFSMHVTPLARAEGGAVISHINITASKRAEAEVRRLNENLEQLVADRTCALQESEERTRQIIETALDAIITVDADGHISGWNPQARAIFGWDASEAVGRSLAETIITPGQRAAQAQVWQQLFDSEKKRLELECTRRDGSTILVELTTASFTHGGKRQHSAFVRDVTEQRKAEAEMLASRRRMSDILNSMFTFVGLFTPEGRMLEVNHAPLELTGMQREQVIGQLLWETGWWSHSTEARDKIRSALERAAAGEIVRDDFEVLSQDGALLVVDAVFNPLRDEAGNITQVVASGVDVTVRKHAEKALRESEQLYRSLIETSGDAVFLVAGDGRILSCNEAAASMHGFTEEEITRMNIRDLDDLEAAKASPARLQRIKQGETLRFELNHRRKDGSIFPLEVVATPVQIAGEWCILANERDITERRRTAERNAAYLHKLRRLSEQSMRLSGDPAAVFEDVAGMIAELFDVPVVCLAEVVGPELRFRAVRLNGQTVRDAGGCPITGTPCATVEATRDLCLYERAQELFPQATLLRDYQAQTYFGVPSLDAAGKVVAITCLLDSRPREFADEDREILRIIAQRVAMELERSRSLAERRDMERHALRSQRMEALGTLSGGVAHDLNNALAPILMGVDMLRIRCPQESKILDIFESSARRGAEMVRQLLTFAKGAEGDLVPLQVEYLVREMEKLMNSSFPKNIQFSISCAPELPAVKGDATQLHQVLLNLCVNARDAMPTGGTLTLDAQPMVVDEAFASMIPDARPGSYVTLRVQDTGTGIPQDIIDRIFDPFFTTKSPDKGTGLGLSTVIGIVRSHGGFLKVTSQDGQGSTFTVFLPALADALPAAVPSSAIPSPAPIFRGHGETILLVDDEEAVREMAGAVLERLNFKVITATNGADALLLAMHHQQELSAIITDLHMPHMDGLSFVRVLRRLQPDIPVVVASGRLEAAQAEEMQELGVTHRLDKPYTERQLSEVLHAMLTPSAA